MNELQALLLGVVQGLTEFLPVSSSGHLVIFENLLGATEEGIVFEVAVHVATLVSVLIVYRRRVAALLFGTLQRDPEQLSYVAKLGIATLPAVVAALLFGDFIEAQFDAPQVAGFCLLATGAILWTTKTTAPRARKDAPTYLAALLIGCAQVVALLPGISRSGTTVAAALALGIAPLAAAEFSFMMSIAAVGGAAVLMLPDLAAVSPEGLVAIGVGGAAALVSGIAAIWLFVRLLRTGGFYHFAFYCWIAGAGVLVWLGARG